MTVPIELPYAAKDLFVLQRHARGSWQHIAGVGAGSFDLGLQELRGPLFDGFGEPWTLEGDEPVRMFGGYYARSALASKVPDDRLVVFGSPDSRLELPDRLELDEVNAALSSAFRQLPRGTREGPPSERRFPDDPHRDYASFIANAARTLRDETARYANNGGSGGVGTPASFVLLVGAGGLAATACDDPQLRAWLTENADALTTFPIGLGNETRLGSLSRALYGEQLRKASPALAEVGTHAVTFYNDPSGIRALFGNTTDNPRGFTEAEGRLAHTATDAVLRARRGFGGVSTDLEAARNWALEELSSGRPITVVRAHEFSSNSYARKEPGRTVAFAADVDRAIRGAGGAAVTDVVAGQPGQAGVTVLGYLPAEMDERTLGIVGDLHASLAERYPYTVHDDSSQSPPPTVHATVAPMGVVFASNPSAPKELHRAEAAEALQAAEHHTLAAVNREIERAAPHGKRQLLRLGRRRKPGPGEGPVQTAFADRPDSRSPRQLGR